MSKKEIIKSLVTQAKKHRKTARDLYSSKHYDWCLFLWHLAIEKILKAKLLSLNKKIIYTHNLTKLYLLTDITNNTDVLKQLDEITAFNMEARYDDDKLAFYKKATKTFATKWQKNCDTIFTLIIKTL